jgi:uncharacterized membrane protein
MMSSGRLEAFSDGVFAIAITLLIIEVGIPKVDESESLARALGDQWPAFASYAVSFVIIGIIWVNHHNLFRFIARVDSGVLYVNLGLLAAVAFLPWPTALLGEYVDAGDNAHIATVIYSVNMTVVGIMFIALWSYLALHPALLADGFTPADARRARRRTWVGPVVYGLTIPLALVSPYACLAVYAVLALYFLVPAFGRITA